MFTRVSTIVISKAPHFIRKTEEMENHNPLIFVIFFQIKLVLKLLFLHITENNKKWIIKNYLWIFWYIYKEIKQGRYFYFGMFNAKPIFKNIYFYSMLSNFRKKKSEWMFFSRKNRKFVFVYVICMFSLFQI